MSSASSGWGTICSSFFLGFSDSGLVDSGFAGSGFLDFGSLSSATAILPERPANLRSSYRKLNWISNNYRRGGRRLLPQRRGFQLFVQSLQDGLPEILHAKVEPP